MERRDMEARVRRMRWPDPPDQLRDRILRCAAISAARVTWSDRVWFSRGWRLSSAAVTTAAILIASLAGGSSSSPGVSPATLANARAVADTSRDLGLSPEVTAALAERALIVAERRDSPTRSLQGRFASVGLDGDRR